jgi:hypothetical protein
MSSIEHKSSIDDIGLDTPEFCSLLQAFYYILTKESVVEEALFKIAQEDDAIARENQVDNEWNDGEEKKALNLLVVALKSGKLKAYGKWLGKGEVVEVPAEDASCILDPTVSLKLSSILVDEIIDEENDEFTRFYYANVQIRTDQLMEVFGRKQTLTKDPQEAKPADSPPHSSSSRRNKELDARWKQWLCHRLIQYSQELYGVTVINDRVTMTVKNDLSNLWGIELAQSSIIKYDRLYRNNKSSLDTPKQIDEWEKQLTEKRNKK